MSTASPAADGSSNLGFNSAPEIVAPRRRRTGRKRGRRRLRRRIAVVVVAVLGISLAVAGGMWYRNSKKGSRDGDLMRATRFYNAQVAVPEKPWLRDKEMQQRLHVPLGWRLPERNNNMALYFKDYKDRLPSEAEMVDEALLKLRSYFRGLEWELKPQTAQARLAGEPAQVLEFQGDDSDQVTMNGECYMTAFRGYGYWFFTWTPLGELEKERKAISAEWAGLRKGLSLLDGRRGWTAKPRITDRVTGRSVGYFLNVVKELWTSEATLHEGLQVDRLFKGQEPDPEHKPLAGKDATVQVLVLPMPKQADLKSATDAALDYLKQREMKLYPQTTWELLKDKNGDFDRDAKIGTEQGHLSKWRVKNTEDLERYWSIAVVNRPEGAIVLFGDCLWDRHDFWDQEFTAMFKTFTVP